MKQRNFFKRSFAFVLTLTIVIGQMYFTPTNALAAADVNDFAVVSPRVANSEVVVSVSPNSPVSIGEIQDELKYIDVGEAVRVNTTNINTTDLSTWYVYDHYDTQYWTGGENQWLSTTGYNKNLRPWYSYTESMATANSSNSNGNCYTLPTTISELSILNGGKHWGYSSKLKEHIYAANDAGKANMTFYGYGGPSGNGFTDFLYYPADVGSIKKVNFQVDANDVQLHSLASAGFLFNCSVNTNGKLNGYAIAFAYNGVFTAATPINGINKVFLLKLTDVDLSTLHVGTATSNRGFLNGTSSTLSTGISSLAGVSLLATKELNIGGNEFSSKYALSDINLTITKGSLLATMTAAVPGASEAPVELFNITEDSNKITDTGFGGFGPFVQYSSHNCGATSSYKFSNLNMSITTTSSLLDAFANADYTQKVSTAAGAAASKKYFVVIGDNEPGSKDQFALNVDDVFLELMKKENVVLITNVDITAGDLGTNKNADYNLEEYLGVGNVFHITATDAGGIAKQIESIVNANTFNKAAASGADDAFSDSENATPGANCYVTYKGYQAGTVNRAKIPDGDIALDIISDGLAVNSGTATYTLIKPAGAKNQTVNLGNTPTVTIPVGATTTEWPSGTYTVTMNYANGPKGITFFDIMACYNVYFNGTTEYIGTHNDHISLTYGTVGYNVAKEAIVYETTLKADSGYVLPTSITVKIGETAYELTKGDSANEGITYAASGLLTIPADLITKDVSIIAEGTIGRYNVTLSDDSNVTIPDVSGLAAYKALYMTTLTPNPGYKLPDDITVKVGGRDLPSEAYRYSSNSGDLIIDGQYIIGDVLITAVGEIGKYNVGLIGSNVTASENTTGVKKAAYNEDYTTTLTAEPGYLLPSNITVTVGGTVLGSEKFSYNQSTGELSINGEDITGDVLITVNGINGQYRVDLIGNNVMALTDTTGANKATYGDLYTTKLTVASGYILPDTIIVKVGDEPLELVDEFYYNQSTGEIIIYGQNITDDVQIIVEVVKGKYDVVLNGTKVSATDGSTGADKAAYNNHYMTTLTTEPGYILPSAITVKVGKQPLTSEEDYIYNSSTGELIIFGSCIDAKITITAAAIEGQYRVDLIGSNVTASENTTGESKAAYDEDYMTTLTADSGYTLPSDITVMVGDNLLAPENYTYNQLTGKLIINGVNITGDVLITAVVEKGKYRVDLSEGSNVTASVDTTGESKATYGDLYKTTLTADSGYILPSAITVNVGSKPLTLVDEFYYNQSTGEVIIYGQNITADVLISVLGVKGIYDVELDGSKVKATDGSTGENKAAYNIHYRTTLTAESGYILPSAITVKVGNQPLTPEEDYIYNSSTGELIIFGSCIDAKITITAAAIEGQYRVDLIGSNVTASENTTGENKAAYGVEYTTTLTADLGYKLSSDITVTVGDTPLEPENYTYNQLTGELSIDGINITGDVLITVNGIKGQYCVDLSEGSNVTALDDTTGENKATFGRLYTTTLTADLGYILPPDITVKVGNQHLKPVDEFYYNQSTGEVIIYGQNIIADVLITVVGVKGIYDVELYGSKVKVTDGSTGANKAAYNNHYMTTLTAEPGYILPSAIKVKIGENELTLKTDYIYNSSTGEITIFGSCIDDSISITAEAIIGKYHVDLVGSNVTATNIGEKQATSEVDYKTTLTADPGYLLPDTIKVKVGGTLVSDYSYSQSTGELTIGAECITGNVEIIVDAVEVIYSVNMDLGSVSVTGKEGTMGDGKAAYKTLYTTKLIPATGYKLPETIVVKVGDSPIPLIPDADYHYNPSTGEVSINGECITGNVLITAVGVKGSYRVTVNGRHVTPTPGSTGEDKATFGDEYTTILTPDLGYKLPDTITVRIGGIPKDLNEDYTYDKDSGVVVVSGSAITGNIMIAVNVNDTDTPDAVITIDTDIWDYEIYNFDDTVYYYNAGQDVVITGSSAGDSEAVAIDKIYYHIANNPVINVEMSIDWSLEYEDGEKPRLEDDGVYYVYAKVVDSSGKYMIVNTDKIIIDKTLPVISGVENEGIYYGDKVITVTDSNLAQVILNGVPMSSNADGTYTIPSGESDGMIYVIEATDLAGNATIYTITMNKPIVHNISGIVQNEDKQPIEGVVVELWQGNNHLKTITDAAGGFSFNEVPRGSYNIVTKFVEGNNTLVTTHDLMFINDDIENVVLTVKLSLGFVDTKIQVNENTPPLSAGGLQELLTSDPEEAKANGYNVIITPEERAKLNDGGAKLEVVLNAQGFEEDNPKYRESVNALMGSAAKDDKIIGLYLDLNVTKYLWNQVTPSNSYENANEITPLNQLPELITVCIPLSGTDLDGKEELTIYRYHEGVPEPEEIRQDKENDFGEYFEIVGDTIILHVRRFSEYAIAYKTNSDNVNVSISVKKDNTLWTDVESVILKDASEMSYPVYNGSFIELKSGIYKVYLNDEVIDIGKSVTVKAGNPDITLNYYTLTLIRGNGISSTSQSGDGVYLEGSLVSITATPSASCIWNKWTDSSGKGFNDSSLKDKAATFNMPGHELILTASATYNTGSDSQGSGGGGGGGTINSVIITKPENGTVSCNPANPDKGSSVTISITPKKGYELEELMITDQSGKSISFIDNGNGTYTYIQPEGTVTVTTQFKAVEVESDSKDEKEPESQELNIPTVYMDKLMGKNQKFALTLLNLDGAKVSCYSTNPKIATVNKKGLVTTNTKLGKCEVVVTIEKGKNKIQYIMSVKVKEGIKKNYSIAKNYGVAYKKPAIATYKLLEKGKNWNIEIINTNETTKISYQSSDKSVAAVDKNGKVTAKKLGRADITVTVEQNGVTNKFFFVIRVTDGNKKSDTSYLRVVK